MTGTAPERRPPNIVMIMADDLGWADLSCYGSTFHETPRLDQLAAEGALFTDAYAAAPVCSPTRASLMAGCYPARVGITQFLGPGGHAVGKLRDVPQYAALPSSEYSMARALSAGGYQTWHVGKWHLGPRRTWPDQHGFDVNIGGCEWGQPQTWFSPYNCPTLSDGPDGEYLTDRITDEAIALLETAGDQPFFLNLWHYAVHIPIEAPEPLVEKYRRKAHDLGLDEIDPFEDGEPLPAWHIRAAKVLRRTVQSHPGYAAMVENLDTNVGRVLDALERLGLVDDTVVIFTSDNGGLSTAEESVTCNLPLSEGKGWTDEGGVREPLVVRWPGVVEPGTRISEPVTSPDFYPTFLSMAGLPLLPEQHLDGVDVMPLLTGQELERGPVFWHYPHYSNQGGRPSAAVRDGRWKLIHDFETATDRLYDLEADLGEHHDLADVETEVRDRLWSTLEAWIAEVGAIVPRRNPYPEPHPGLASYFLAGAIVPPHERAAVDAGGATASG